MYLKTNKHRFGFFIVIVFFLLKMVNLHAFEHIFTEEVNFADCATCEYYITNDQHNPITSSPEIQEFVPFVFPIAESTPIILYVTPSVKTWTHEYYFNKPPPSLI